MNYEQLALIRGFNDTAEFVGFDSLFSSTNRKRGYVVGNGSEEVHWRFAQIFVTGEEVESFDCKRARRMACGDALIEFDEPCPLSFPGRYLIADESALELVTRQRVKIRWQLSGLIEMPQFCVSVVERETWAVLGPIAVEGIPLSVLGAAADLKPRQWDIFGFVTEDERLAGALEIVGPCDGDVYEVNVIAARETPRALKAGDPLWAKYGSRIKKTDIYAEAMIAEVLEVGDAGLGPPVVPLRT